jgi:hypothetical protein
MSQLTPLLRQITKKASHPNGLLYGMQLERARVKYLVRGELEGGKEAVQLGAPEAEVGVGVEAGKEEVGKEGGVGVDGGVKEGVEDGGAGKEV